ESTMRRILLTLIACLSFAGCSGYSGPLRAVKGEVTLQGAPLDQGTVTFFAPQSQTPAAVALIKQGKYMLPAEQGLLPGKYRVVPNSLPSREVTPEEYAAGKSPLAEPQERIPAKYNTASQEEVEVTDKGPNEFKFAIE